MSLHTTRKCDECGAPRGDTNHWWAVVGEPSSPRLMTSKLADKEVKNLEFPRLDACSHKCVTTMFNRWLDTGTVIKRKAKRPRPTARAVENTLDGLEEGARLLTGTEAG